MEGRIMTKPRCKLVGTDGNVFNVIKNVANSLKEAGLRDQAEEFRTKAFEKKSYDGVLRLAMEYVEVE
jgi:hypothetical protein